MQAVHAPIGKPAKRGRPRFHNPVKCHKIWYPSILVNVLRNLDIIQWDVHQSSEIA